MKRNSKKKHTEKRDRKRQGKKELERNIWKTKQMEWKFKSYISLGSFEHIELSV